MMSGVDWGTIAAMTVVITAGGSIVLVVLRSQLSHFFVTRTEFAEAEHRLTNVEQKLAMLPTHADFRSITDQLATVVSEIRAMAERTAAVRGLLGRVESQVDMLFRAKLEEEGRTKA